MTNDRSRSIELEIEVAGTPEEVWAAIASGPGITAWLHPTELEEREGGRMTYDMGAGAGGDATIREWEPPRRYVEEATWSTEGAEPTVLATEWTVEAQAGGTCRVRMVTSGFPSGAAWDEEIEGFTEAMEVALENLRLHRAHFAGEEGTWLRVYADAGGSWADGLAGSPRHSGSTAPHPGRGWRPRARARRRSRGRSSTSPAGAGRVTCCCASRSPPGAGEHRRVGAGGDRDGPAVPLRGRGGARRRPRAAGWEAWTRARFPAA